MKFTTCHVVLHRSKPEAPKICSPAAAAATRVRKVLLRLYVALKFLNQITGLGHRVLVFPLLRMCIKVTSRWIYAEASLLNIRLQPSGSCPWNLKHFYNGKSKTKHSERNICLFPLLIPCYHNLHA